MIHQCSSIGFFYSVDFEGKSVMRLVLLHRVGASLHSLLSFLTFQTFSWRYIISVSNKMDAVTDVWEPSKEQLQALVAYGSCCNHDVGGAE